MDNCTDTAPPLLLALTVKSFAVATAEAVPPIAPVLALSESPLGSAGEMKKPVAAPPACVGAARSHLAPRMQSSAEEAYCSAAGGRSLTTMPMLAWAEPSALLAVTWKKS